MQYLQLSTTDELPEIAALSPFKAVVIVAEPVTESRRQTVSRWLVESGCAYVMAWGDGCARWAEAVEQVNRAAFSGDEIPDERIVMTTFHARETLADLFWFAKHTAMHPCFELDTLLLDLSAVNRAAELSALYAAA
jgi:hypothetical protein